MDPLTHHIVEYTRAVEGLVGLVRADGMTTDLGDEHSRDLTRALIERDASLPAALMAAPVDQQKIRATAALQALRRDDPDAFLGPFTPYYLLLLRRALEAPHAIPDHDVFAMDQMYVDLRRRLIKIVRARLREAHKEIPAFDPAEYGLAAPNARRAHQIELARAEASKPYAAKPAITNGTIAGLPQVHDLPPPTATDRADVEDRDARRPVGMRLQPMIRSK